MFDGALGKKMMIEQGYVPPTCTLHESLAGPLIWSEMNAGRDPCAGCREKRARCGGRPNRETTAPLDFATQMRESLRRDEEDERRRRAENPMPSPWEEIK
jgi:hypothetical protein